MTPNFCTSSCVPLSTKSDPEIKEGFKNPKVMKAFQELMSGPGGVAGIMSNPAKLQEMMADPEVSKGAGHNTDGV